MKKLFYSFLMMTILLPGLAMGEESPIGKIKNSKGNVLIIRTGVETTVNTGDPLCRNDILRTGAKSSVGIIFNDNTMLSLGPKSEIVINEYVFAPKEGKLSLVASMVKGTFAYLSGIIGRHSPESVKFQTPDATIGIRGTKFLVQVEESYYKDMQTSTRCF